MKSKIKIELHMVIEDHGHEESSKQTLVGDYFSRNNMDVIMFEEKIDEEIVVKSLVTIKEGTVNIKRTGPISMNQQFQLKSRTENVYTHPHGTLHMETFTKLIDYVSLENEKEGHLIIKYDVKLNGQDERNHELTLNFIKEEEQ